MAFDSEIDFDEPIPVFPLAQIVLMPYATVPLHVFESRYRSMARDALSGDRLIAMAVFEGDAEAWAEHYAGAPPIKPCVCVGRIVEHQRLPDGRYNVLLQGRARARIVEELPVNEDGYRTAMLEPIEPDPAMEIDLTTHRKRLIELIRDPRMSQLAAMGQVRQWLTGDLPTMALVDAMALVLCREASERYAMLAEPDAHARAERVIATLRETRDVLAAAEPMYASAKTEEGFFLN
jgi:Lon protease-like protein